MGVLIAGDVEEQPDGFIAWCSQGPGPCDWCWHGDDVQAGRDALRRHSYDKHNPEGKPYPYED